MPGNQAGHSVVVQPRVNGRNGNMRVDSRQRVAHLPWPPDRGVAVQGLTLAIGNGTASKSSSVSCPTPAPARYCVAARAESAQPDHSIPAHSLTLPPSKSKPRRIIYRGYSAASRVAKFRHCYGLLNRVTLNGSRSLQFILRLNIAAFTLR